MTAPAPATEDDAGPPPAAGTQRLDKWLWFARVIKTRTQAAGLVTEGRVRLNRQRVDKPSQPVRAGDVVTVTVRGHIRVLKVLLPGVRRGPPPEARTLFEEIVHQAPPQPGGPASAHPGSREAGQGRPTKRDRRQINRLREPED